MWALRRGVMGWLVAAFGGAVACSAAQGTTPGGAGGTGGTSPIATGGAPAGGGALATGGAPGSGGQPLFASCTAAELASACAMRECGELSTCQGSCGECPEGEVCSDGRCVFPNCEGPAEECACGDIQFQIPTRQSCSLNVAPGTTVDGEAFIHLAGIDHRVFAMNRWGKGHVIAWCDASTTGLLWGGFNVSGYLGQRANPRVASFGNESTCKPGILQGTSIPEDIEYLGSELPAEYLGDPAKLAADWDALVFCGYHTAWDPGWAALLQSYVSDYGRGLLTAMDYVGWDIKEADFTAMSAVLAPTGISYNAVSLDYADTSLDMSIECVVDLPPPIVK